MLKLREIIYIPGTPGLFKIVAKAKNGFIIESLVDSKRSSVVGTEPTSNLSDIAVFTTGEDMPLREVMKKIMATDGNKLSVDPKGDPKALKEYFKKVIPEIDDARVYASDMKRILTWYTMLHDKVDFNEEESSDDDKLNLKSDDERDRPMAKTYDSHAPKAEIHAKTSTAKTRKKV